MKASVVSTKLATTLAASKNSYGIVLRTSDSVEWAMPCLLSHMARISSGSAGLYPVTPNSSNFLIHWCGLPLRRISLTHFHCCPRRDRPVAWPAENTRLGGTPVGYLGGGLRIKVAQPVQVIPKPG